MNGKALPGEAATRLLLALALFAFYLITHPYRGVHGDALIYVTRAWAPPALVNGDMLFAHEQQTSLTLYAWLLRATLKFMPVAEAARALALAGAAIWFYGLIVFTQAVARAARLTPAAGLAMAAVTVLAPLGYSAGSSFMAGEVLAVPRPFAEGFVLLAFAALLGKRWIAAAALVAAFVFHPLMGLAGGAVVFCWAAVAHRRLWLVALAAAGIGIAAAALGAPLVSPLLATFDADWLSLLRARTSYLFLTQAPESFWIDVLLRGAILVIAARHSAGSLRSFLIAVVVASGGGIAISLAFADLWPSLLVTQLQPWRVLFVTAVVAPASVVLIAGGERGSQARITLALIACAYMTRDAAAISAFFSLGALAFQFHAGLASAASPRVEALLWMTAAAAWIGFDLLHLFALAQIVSEAPSGFAFQWSYLWTLRPLSLPLATLVIFVALRAGPPRPWLAAGVALVGVALAMLRFDDRAPVDVSMEQRRAPDLVSALPPGDKPVLWLSLGKEAWYWLDRPNWAAPVQASSIVFSRDLARAWRERMQFLVDQQIYAPEVLGNQTAPGPRTFSAPALAAVCARADAPAAIVAPLRASDVTPETARRVAAPAPSFLLQAGTAVGFERIESYAVWTCAQEPAVTARGAR